MKIVRVSRAGGKFELMEEQIREPEPGSVRIKVQACGVCHSDLFTKEGAFPGIVYPRAPGHEVAGVIDAVAGGAGAWKVGDSSRSWMARRPLRTMRIVSPRRFHQLREAADSWNQL